MEIIKIDFDNFKKFIFNNSQYKDFVINSKTKEINTKSYLWDGYEKQFEELVNNFNKAKKLEIKINCLDFENDNYHLIKLCKIYYLIPTQFCLTKEFDFSKGSNSELITQNELLKAKENINKEYKLTKKETEKDLDNLKKELEKIEQAITEKKQLMEQKIEKLKDDIFIVNSHLMKFRCLYGDSFKIIKLRDGKKANRNTPLIIYQKFRYLDEEMLKMSNISYEDWYVEDETINDFFKNNDLAFNTFCPSQKCVTTFKNTSENYYPAKDIYGKLIDEMEYFRGNQLGVLIRDGYNLWLCWIDEDITLKDNTFMSRASSLKEKVIDFEKISLRSGETRTMLNRYYLLLIINVLILKEKLINIPNIEDIEDIFNCENIIFSEADNSLIDNRFPTLRDFIIQETKNMKVGDEIFTIKYINGEKWDSWSGRYIDRSFGDKNRGYDIHIAKNEIIKISKIYEGKDWHGKSYVEYYIKASKNIWSKTYNNYKDINVNIQIEDDEYIPLKNVTEELINYWIETKNVGTWMKYNEVIDSLKKLKKIIKERGKQ